MALHTRAAICIKPNEMFSSLLAEERKYLGIQQRFVQARKTLAKSFIGLVWHKREMTPQYAQISHIHAAAMHTLKNAYQHIMQRPKNQAISHYCKNRLTLGQGTTYETLKLPGA